jgi:hypothetical protein
MKKLIFAIVGLVLLLGCQEKANKVRLIKQWHLSSGQNTQDITASKKLPQFQNQKDIYLQVSKLIEKKETSIIIAEGCEGQINNKFTTNFNGWDMESLVKKRDLPEFSDIMAPVPMKLKAKYPEVTVLCGDNLKLINENLRAMSDLRGFSGFFQRMKASRKTNLEKFNAYSEQLKKLFPKDKIKDPIQYSLKKSLNALGEFESLIKQRNEFFVRVAKESIEKNPVVIIGGLHVTDLQQRFYVDKIESEIIVPLGYSNDEQKLIYALKEILQNEIKREITLFQTPVKFDLKKFPIKNKISVSELFSPNEKKEMDKITKGIVNFEILLSDYDGDGIRDFTLSSSADGLILSSEDPDWDNDGKMNLIDETVGDVIVAKLDREVRVNNNFLSQADKESILKLVQKNVVLLQDNDVSHELLVLELFNTLTTKTPLGKNQIKIIKATTPSFSYGENVFFSYIKHTNVLEYYPVKLNEYINKEYQKRFYGVEFKKYINAYVLPLLVHSLSHEVGHSLGFEFNELTKKNGWSWSDRLYKGKYLIHFRHPLKKITQIKTELLFNGRDFKAWLKEYKSYSRSINKILKEKNLKKQVELAKKTKFFVKAKGSVIEHKLSFFAQYNLPSIYALKNPSEWFAESYATCIFKLIYPKSSTQNRAIEIEHLLGFYPLATNEELCLKLTK